MLYKYFISPLLFLFHPETAHHITMRWLSIGLKIPFVSAFIRSSFSAPSHPLLNRKLFGLELPNPIGLAAGFDKNAEYLHSLPVLGFGFYEIGTVTPRPQAGNPTPRLFRLPADKALINRMGFNNIGCDEAATLLQRRPKNLIIGGNIGKNKDTPNEEALKDYLICFEKLYHYVDYFVINVSSPNTPGLRELQEKEPLIHLLNGIQEKNRTMVKAKPILLKIAPDLTDTQLDDIAEIVELTHLAGLIATNTTIKRDGLATPGERVTAIGNGGLSGQPLTTRSTEVIAYLRKKLPETPIIGVGGIMTPEDVLAKMKAGADAVQVYTGLVYYGPALIKDACQALVKYWSR